MVAQSLRLSLLPPVSPKVPPAQPCRIASLTTVLEADNWCAGGGRALQYAVSISELEGKYVVCAAINNARDSLDGQAIRALDVTANDQVIVNGLGWAPRYNTVSLEGSRASCRLTGVAVIPGARLDTDLSRNRFRG